MLALLIVRLANAWGLALPECKFRAVTGVPCLGCGSTRAALALSRGEWLAALTWNPAAALGALVVGVVFLVWLVDLVFGTRGIANSKRCLTGAPLAWAVGVGLALNWIYLIVANAR